MHSLGRPWRSPHRGGATPTLFAAVLALLLASCVDDDGPAVADAEGQATESGSGAVASNWWELDDPLAMEDAAAIAEDGLAPYDHRSYNVLLNIDQRLLMMHDASMLSCLSMRGMDVDGVAPGPPRKIERGEWLAMNNTQFPDVDLLAERGTRMAIIQEPDVADGYVLSDGAVVAEGAQRDISFCLAQIGDLSTWRALKDLQDAVLESWWQVLDEIDADPDLDPGRSTYRGCLTDAGVPDDALRPEAPIGLEFQAYFSWMTNRSTEEATERDADEFSARYGSVWAECARDLMAEVYERREAARDEVLEAHKDEIAMFARGVFVDVLEAPEPEEPTAAPDAAAPLWERDLSDLPDDELEHLLINEAAERVGLTEDDFQTQDWANLPEVREEYEALRAEVEETGGVTPP